MSNLGVVRAEQGRFQEAEELYQRALQIRREALGDEHPDVQQTLRNIGRLQERVAQYQDAETPSEEA